MKRGELGLNYIPLDTDIITDEKVCLLENRFGLVGFGVLIKLYLKIYKAGYYYTFNKVEQEVFILDNKIKLALLNDILNYLFELELLDKNLYTKYNVLSSRGIQKRYLAIYSKLPEIKIINKYLLLKSQEINMYENVVLVYEKSDNKARLPFKYNLNSAGKCLSNEDANLLIDVLEL